MQRIARSALIALFAVMCMGALGAGSASAVQPLYLTESKKALLVSSDNLGEITLRGRSAGIEGTIKCEKSGGHGFLLDKSSLIREISAELSGKCEQTIGTSKGTCTEPIKPVSMYGELGLLNGIVVMLIAPESGETFVEVKCTNGNTKITGTIIGEYKLNSRDGTKQYGVDRKVLLGLDNATGNKQNIQEIELLGTKMTGDHLRVESTFFTEEEAAVEAKGLCLVDGNVLIDP